MDVLLSSNEKYIFIKKKLKEIFKVFGYSKIEVATIVRCTYSSQVYSLPLAGSVKSKFKVSHFHCHSDFLLF